MNIHEQRLAKLLEFAKLYGTCTRRNVGAEIIGGYTEEGDKFITQTVNMPAFGARNLCIDGFCPRGMKSVEEVPPGAPYGDCTYVHAEARALLEAGEDKAHDAVLYITEPPCWDCAKLIAYCRVREVHCYGPVSEASANMMGDQVVKVYDRP